MHIPLLAPSIWITYLPTRSVQSTVTFTKKLPGLGQQIGMMSCQLPVASCQLPVATATRFSKLYNQAIKQETRKHVSLNNSGFKKKHLLFLNSDRQTELPPKFS
jgi:hypothetical protein